MAFRVEGLVEELLGVLRNTSINEDSINTVEFGQGGSEGRALGEPRGYVGGDVEEAWGGEESLRVDSWAVWARGLEVQGDDVVGWVQGVDEEGGG